MNETVWPTVSILIGAILVSLLAAYLLRIRKDLKSGYPLEDERTERLNGKAAMGTYYITIFIVIELLWIIFSNEKPSLPEIDTGYTLVAVMIVMGASFGTLRWIYGKKVG
jgi:uncharacterized membrane protein